MNSGGIKREYLQQHVRGAVALARIMRACTCSTVKVARKEATGNGETVAPVLYRSQDGLVSRKTRFNSAHGAQKICQKLKLVFMFRDLKK